MICTTSGPIANSDRMSPIPLPKSVPPPTTVRPLSSDDGLEHFLKWAADQDCSEGAIHLADVLLADKSSMWLRSTLDALAHGSNQLSRWEASGTDTCGISKLADSLVNRTSEAAMDSGRFMARSALSDFTTIKPTPYLQASLSCREPEAASADALATFRTLRIWLLVEATERAANGNRLDSWLEVVADGLRKAGEDDYAEDWLPTIALFSPPPGTLDGLRLYLMRECSSCLADTAKLAPGTARARFFQAVLAIARGQSSPRDSAEANLPPWPLASSWLSLAQEPANPFPQQEHLALDEDPENLAPVRPASSADPEDDGEQDLATTAVDPQESTGEQSARHRYISLAVAARSRLTRWNWEVINPTEEGALMAQIARAYAASSDMNRQIAAMSELSLLVGHSLGTALRLGIDQAPPGDSAWTIDLQDGRLRRRPPRRSKHERTLLDMAPHLAPDAAELGLEIPAKCLKVLRDMRSTATSPGPILHLRDLWPYQSISPGEAFTAWLKDDPILHRLTPGMLGSVAERRLYAADPDWLKARLLANTTDSGLPAAGAYGAYTGAEITDAIAGWWASSPHANSAGSLIDAADSFYRGGLARMRAHVAQAALADDFIEHHNRTSLYWDTALRAATGVRPEDDLWVWSHIDFKSGYAFIDDKTGIDVSAARWVVLPYPLLDALERDYLDQHVPQIASLLRQEFGEASSDACANLQRSLVWLRRDDDQIVAESLGRRHRGLNREWAAEYPLVTNAFRHRARTSWRRLGCNPEIIDSLLGHSDGASRTHGDYSPRVWAADADAARNAIERSFELLDFHPPELRQHQSLERERSVPISKTFVPGTGTASDAKALARWRTLLRAARQAAEQLSLGACRAAPELLPKISASRLPIRILLTAIAEWTEADANDAVKSLTTTLAGTPATLGALRLLFVGRVADRAWEETGTRIPLRRRSFSMMSRDEPRASTAGIGARHRHGEWKELLEKIHKAVPINKLKPAMQGLSWSRS